ncbi:MAG TPA: hypothetical protein VFF30_09455 [Nitrososphaerales archaeon]|nr:hypothetical protein [Nitrososphaerales archaeon]
MNEKHPSALRLGGTTLKVYRILYAEGKPLGLNEIQKRARLSSPSVAHYHLSKLINQGLVSEKEDGYVAERAIFENTIRIRRSLVPLQTTFALFFGTTLVGLLLFVRPTSLSSLYALALIVNVAALAIFVYQTYDALKKWRV